MDHSAGENDRHKIRTVTKKSMQTVLKNLEGFYIISIDHSENLFVYHKSRRSNDQEKTKDQENTKEQEKTTDIRRKDRTG